jgi:6,7-dimethyl-8-ribityllumazine synthase
MRDIQGHFQVPTGQIAIVAARFNDLIVDQLIKGAQDTFVRHGIPSDSLDCVRVPGAYEIPFICKQLADTQRYQGIVALGAVVRGSTPHFDYVANSCASGILQASIATNVPMTFGILTTDTLEQALERAGTKAGNKGADAALSLIEMVSVVNKING